MADVRSFAWSFRFDGAPYKLQSGDWFTLTPEPSSHILQFGKGGRLIEVVTEQGVMTIFRLGIPADWALVPSLVTLMTGMRAAEVKDVDGIMKKGGTRVFRLETHDDAVSSEAPRDVTSRDPLRGEVERL